VVEKIIDRLLWNPPCRATEDAGMQYTVSALEAAHEMMHELEIVSFRGPFLRGWLDIAMERAHALQSQDKIDIGTHRTPRIIFNRFAFLN
jgi:hypothetical protein